MSALRVAAAALALSLLAPLAVSAQDTARPATLEELAPDPLMRALSHWAMRSLTELALPDAPRPRRSVFATFDYEHLRVRAELGALSTLSRRRYRPTRVEVIVGEGDIDSGRFRNDRAEGAWREPSLVTDDVAVAIERDLWITSDGAYKDALQLLNTKLAARAASGGSPPPDWSVAAPVVSHTFVELPGLEPAPLVALAERASARLRGLGLERGEVRINTVEGHFYLASSEGTSLVEPDGYATVVARGELLSPDGVTVYGQRQWVMRHLDDRPSDEEIERGVAELGASLQARAAAARVEWYEGPVVFEGEAAAQFFRHLLPEELEGTPPVPREGRSYEQQTRSGPRLGRHLLPAGWSVDDEPGRWPGLPGAFVHDREGVPSERVSLVEDGYVRDLVMSRVPRKELTRSNGHARGATQGLWSARLAQWRVDPGRSMPSRRFWRTAERARQRGGQDAILVVRRLARGRTGSLPVVQDAVWRAADGSETPVAALQFQRVDRRTLRAIAAVGGGQQRLSYLAAWEPGRWPGVDNGLGTTVETPSLILVDDLELVFPGPDSEQHLYPPPPGLAAE